MLNLIAIAIAVYCLAMAALWYFQRSLLYFPDTQRRAPTSGFAEVDYRADDGLKLTGWRSTDANQAAPTILVFHGNVGAHADRAWKGVMLRDAGYNLFLAGYRGYGGNPGKPSETGLERDAEAALAYLKADGVDPTNIILYGESLGTGVALKLAARQRFKAIVLEAPYFSIARLATDAYGWIAPVRLFLSDRYESHRLVSKISSPLLVMHGRYDEVIPIEHARELFDLAPDPKQFYEFPRAGHNDLYKNGAEAPLLNFLSNL